MSLSPPGWLNELEPTALIIISVVLILFPEPATSTLGTGLLLLGVSWWFYEWHR